MEGISALRVGLGTDRHALAAGIPLRLGSVLIETSPVGPVAHSDGDVVLHALVDALLGACALGDIGDHFPPEDARWKQAEGLRLWQLAWHTVQTHYPRVALLNVDVTVHLEKPKLGAYKGAIRHAIAEELALPVERVSLKAKTAEKLGPVGTGQAIDAQAVLLLSLLGQIRYFAN